ncbi:hypothetical protein SAMD00019534_044030 [Acytostelium subglobosum LB1]|uniref:hypothetical protein n=1 Tax=Acytostelium subglobosum LB1 TaxID=1410327 RepID=UPI0006449D67|nr:hypothetical protein SAMD00019534_044030 [Acytostelium subglobosum LB1]GAM21228.1 hypothetical protein SAMD00019534_044030 [Acytostelium subglobosum LB1]|eukprot:XP_012755347.1 hypothetical protein SAMD00019534_044030 [Acytostelium subglobosum LB1]
MAKLKKLKNETKDEKGERRRVNRAGVKGFGGKKSPEENANIFTKLTWDWANSFVWFCFRNVLEHRHIWNLASYDTADNLTKRMTEQWEKEKIKPKPSYQSAAVRAFGPYFTISWIYYAIYAASQFVGPELLKRMVSFVVRSRMGATDVDPNMGYYYAVAMFGSAMVGSFCLYQANMISARVGDYMRSVIVCDVYKKSLKLSNSARSKTSPGEIVNLMSNDAQRMTEVFQLVNNGVFAPFQIIVCIVLLYISIGWPTFVGLAFMLITVPINGIAAKRLIGIRRALIKYTDGRVKTTNEILQAIKIIKLYAWEDSFAKRVMDRRADEIKMLMSFSHVRAVLIFFVASLPTIVSVLVFTTYFKTQDNLDAGNIFAALAYLNILRMPLGFLPIIIALMVQLKVAAQRVTDFLLQPEMEVSVQTADDDSRPTGVHLEGASFAWSSDKEESFKLNNINLNVTGKSLTVVVGSVGSGKSSLIQAVLGEMERTAGSQHVKGKIAYVAQQAWIINASLKDNIVFGSPYDEERYNRVIEVCALQRDIELFPQGDNVEIGERGVNLSGGQKQRVSIARAVYNDADIYILDDPLSAVDAHVGKHLFHKCINGMLKEKTVILAANQLQYLPFADEVLVITDGTITERGTYHQIMESKQTFSKQLEDYGIEEMSSSSDSGEDGVEEEIIIEEKTKPKEKVELKNTDGTLVQQEEREEGSVSVWMYIKYFTAGGGAFFTACFTLFLLDIGSSTVLNWWLSKWSNDTQYAKFTGKTPSLTNDQYLYIYIGIGLFSIIMSGLRNFAYFTYTVKAGQALHDQLFTSLLRAPMWFFDTTPLGRILNRFTRDLDGVDNLIAAALSQYIVFFLFVLATIIIIAIVIPFLLVPMAPIVVLFYILQSFYRHTSRELQRLESISRSPIFAHFSETLNGVATIRAYKTQDRNIAHNHKLLDANNQAYLTLQAMQQWLGLRLDLLGNLIIFFTALFITIDKKTVDIGSVGLALSYALSITTNLNRATLQAADTETKMNSVERIVHYIKGPVEAQQIIKESRPAADWPQHGAITFDNLVMRYREGLDPVLKGISCEIKPKEKIGIVGRTGAGKSSIVLALFRLIEASEGRILIDGKDISSYGLKDLRRNLSIIPQDPVLFSGTLRDNLDPFNESTDEELWDLLENIQLHATVKNLDGGLLCKVTENGENWSVGQRQLICLGRALLRKPKILVLDEATASVDSNTDALIQQTVRAKFSDCTILTIAHRLNTIMDSNRIMVLDAGRISEFDTPHNLLQNTDGLLSWLVDETGPQNSQVLRKMAKEGAYAIALPEDDMAHSKKGKSAMSKSNGGVIVIPEVQLTPIDGNNNNTDQPGPRITSKPEDNIKPEDISKPEDNKSEDVKPEDTKVEDTDSSSTSSSSTSTSTSDEEEQPELHV